MLIPKSVFHLHNVASADVSRHSINGILLERGAATATDGRSLLRAEWTPGPDAKYPQPASSGPLAVTDEKWSKAIVPAKTCAAILKASPKQCGYGALPILNQVALDESANGETSGRLAVTDLESVSRFDIPNNDASFPNWQKVMTEPGAGVEIGFTISLLENVLFTMRKMGARAVRMTIKDSETQVRLDGLNFESGDDRLTLFGVVMPLHIP